MLNSVSISNKINKFNYTIDNISGDKSLSIRWALMASQAVGKSKGFNILNSEDVNNTISFQITHSYSSYTCWLVYNNFFS